MPTTEYGAEAIALTRQLIECQSVTPNDAGCQEILMQRLMTAGFACESMRFGDVDNFWASRGQGDGTLVFAGHTDVVPTGPEARWSTEPFTPTERDGVLYGRGTADMKASLAAMTVAAEAFTKQHGNHIGRLAFLITADEEGPATDGTVKVVEELISRGEKLDWCVVGEPSSSESLGDIIKNGRRGSINGVITIRGKQGHIAYPQFADNPIHAAFLALDALAKEPWDEGNAFFEPTRLQFGNIQAGTGATNIIPGTLTAQFNVRFSTETDATTIRSRCERILSAHVSDFDIEWRLSGEPFLTKPGALVDAVSASIESITGTSPTLSTGGGTSDGRFIAKTGTQIVELGPINASIHQVDEHILLSDIPRLTAIYFGIMTRLLTAH
jgi:succinyl-diaminopimelate desuccinylase